ncbi:MAG: NAD-dependent epimerase [Pseudobdellovibrionaceae bacterium]
MAHKIFVTGAAGFIGFHLTQRLIAEGHSVHGIDNLNDYYDVQLKEDRLSQLQKLECFSFTAGDLADRKAIETIYADFQPDVTIHLGAQAGVRYSLDNPYAYIDSNIVGTLNILEGCRHTPTKHLIYASSSSVYGANTKVPFAEEDGVDHPVSLYAATKKSNEMMAHAYAHLYRIPVTGLRFFTVYGPWGRPDMAYFKFMNAMVEGKPIDVYNHGDMMRDFTYIDDIVEGIVRLIPTIPTPDPTWDSSKPAIASSSAPYRVYNIGNSAPEKLMDMIRILQEESGLTAKLNMLPMQPGDVYATSADTSSLEAVTGFKPYTPLRDGLASFVRWYRDYYGLGNGPVAKEA